MNPQIALIVFAAFFGIANGKAISVDARIRHGLNGVFVSVFIIFFAIQYYMLHGFWYSLGYVAIHLLIARVVFDTVLNIYRFHRRGLFSAINYVSENPKSIIDRIEKRIFGYNGYAPKIIYIIFIISLNLLIRWQTLK